MSTKARTVLRGLLLDSHALFAGLGHEGLPKLQKVMEERLPRRLA